MIEVKKLTKTFFNGNGVRNISFTIKRGDIVGMVGDNGAGKSTIIKSIFNEYKKDSGELFYDGVPMKKTLFKEASFFPDQSLYPNNITVKNFCLYSGILSGLKNKESKVRTDQLLKYLGLVEYRNKTFKKLSAGMQKRALLAITMVSDPNIIIFDEPTANLDVSTRVEFMELIKKLARQDKIILITSHIINELQGLINKLIIIKEGELVFGQYLAQNDNILDIYKKFTKANGEQKGMKNILDVFSS
ncbi:ABC transporter ATP-binding protein [Spiroplasma chinense]|uniref:ABC transporter ATP-binding protein n=1 Tax=Spiroplasma chinense TaxID=216932 RepID=A0A5B9Y5B4_9MOLU|nr:ABC transporter ATP-binding protein [Spiroplasma chinense]QEH62358.1 ABC transporter ATP-binding protein [Spiroplasma chinense]